MLWVVGGALEAFSTQSCMLLMMNALGFSVPQKNTYTLGITAVGQSIDSSHLMLRFRGLC
jgi:ACS family pantothenate transporter-like MFS transporter